MRATPQPGAVTHESAYATYTEIASAAAVEWFFPDQIAPHEGTKPRQARRKYSMRAQQSGAADQVTRYVPSNGGFKKQFHISILDEATLEKLLARQPKSVPAPCTGPEISTALVLVSAPGRNIIVREALNQLLPLEGMEAEPHLSAIPKDKLPWARARRKVIAPLLPNNDGEAQWERWRGQCVHGVLIQTKEDFVRALVLDSKAAQPLLIDWNGINRELREATGKPNAQINPIYERLVWKLLSWYAKGRPFIRCARCGGTVGQRTFNCEKCESRQCLPPGLEALQDLDRCDKGEIRLTPEHAKYLTAAYLGGDESVSRRKHALERPRSIAESQELIKLEISAGTLAGPTPSYYQLRRFIHEFIPRSVRDYGRLGEKRAFARRGPYIHRSHDHLQVNDIRYWDFRRLNVRTWIEADGKLYRPFLCAGMDAGSRDVVFNFDLYPSAQLFKSTLRMAELKWGVAREEWMDNGKEFTCEEVTGSRGLRTWTERFEVDDECLSVFDKLGSAPHYCLKENPTGKALLERFFQTFDRYERKLPGWTGEAAGNRPQRLKEEEREHMLFCSGERARTPLLRFDALFQHLSEMAEYRYRHCKHSGDGMHGRTPAQVQAAFQGERKIPRADELDILLWHRRVLTARGDKVFFHYHGRSLVFRSEQLLVLPGDALVEVHVDPINADRALAISAGRVITLTPINPTGGQSTFEVKEEIHRKRRLEKAVRQATHAGSRLAPIPSPERELAMVKAQAERKIVAMEAERRDTRTEFSIPVYGAAADAMREARTEAVISEKEPPVFTSRTEAEEWQRQKQRG